MLGCFAEEEIKVQDTANQDMADLGVSFIDGLSIHIRHVVAEIRRIIRSIQ